MTRRTTPAHPEATTLHSFVLGQSSGEEMDWVEQHVSTCDTCASVAESLPGDHLLGLLRRPTANLAEAATGGAPIADHEPAIVGSSPHAGSLASGLRRLLGLCLLAGAVLFPGCGGAQPVGEIAQPDSKSGRDAIKPPQLPGKIVPPDPARRKPGFVPG